MTIVGCCCCCRGELVEVGEETNPTDADADAAVAVAVTLVNRFVDDEDDEADEESDDDVEVLSLFGSTEDVAVAPVTCCCC